MSLVTYDSVVADLDRSAFSDDEATVSWIKARIASLSLELAGPQWCAQPLEHTSREWGFSPKLPVARKLLPYFPVWTIDTVEVRSGILTYTEIDAEGYDLEEDQGLYYLHYPEGFLPGYRYRVTLTCGYRPADTVAADMPGVDGVPAGLASVVRDMIAHEYEQIFGKRRDLKSEADTHGSVTRAFVTTEEKRRQWREQLAPYTTTYL